MSELTADPGTGAVPEPRGRRPVPDAPPIPSVATERTVPRWVARARPLLLPLLDTMVLVAVVVAGGVTGWWAPCYVGGVLLALAAEGQHRLRICLRVSDQVPRLATCAALPLVVLLPGLPVQRVVSVGLSALGALVVARGGTFLVLRAVHRRGFLLEPTLVIGADGVGADLVRALHEHPDLGLRPLCPGNVTAWASDSPLWSESTERVTQLIDAQRISRIVVCSAEAAEGELTALLRACRRLPVDVCVVPRLPELGLAVPRAVLDEIWGIPLVPLRRPGAVPAALLKRVFDVVVATVLLVALAPVLAVASAVIRVSNAGSPWFRQERITLAGRARSMIKLRTATDEPDGLPCWTVDSRRCTAFGAWLRATHLDEVPQLINVVRGEMSLVGPRPERPYYAVRFAREIARYADRHRAPGGMTGWAQVHGLHGDTSIEQRARFDNVYIEYWSPWLDIVILARTPAAVLGGFARLRATTRGGSA